MVDWFSFIEPSGSFSSANQIPVPGLFEFLPFAVFSVSLQSITTDSIGLYFWFTMIANVVNLAMVCLGLKVVMNITSNQLYNGEYVVNNALGISRVSSSSYNATNEFEILRVSYVVVAAGTSIILLYTILNFISFFLSNTGVCTRIVNKKIIDQQKYKRASLFKKNSSSENREENNCCNRRCRSISVCKFNPKAFLNSGIEQEWIINSDSNDDHINCVTSFWWKWGLFLLIGVILPHLMIILIAASLSIPIWTTRDSPHFFTLTGLCMMYLFPPVGHAFHVSNKKNEEDHDHCKPSWWFGYLMFVFGLVFSYMNTILDYVTIVKEENNPFTVDGFMNAVTCTPGNSTTGPGFAFTCSGSNSETLLFKYQFAALSIGYQTTSLLFITVSTITLILATCMNYLHLTAPDSLQCD